VKKLYLAALLLALTACSGYQPLYGELGNEMNEIGLKNVKMKHVEKNIGSRRLAQILNEKLSRIFTNTTDNDYDLVIELKPSESAIATRSDDTDKRKGTSVTANMKLFDTKTGKMVFETSISRSSTYTTQAEPFATEAARTKALESIVSALSNDIIQRAALWFRGYTDNEDNI
jgi:hypothetical protein